MTQLTLASTLHAYTTVNNSRVRGGKTEEGQACVQESLRRDVAACHGRSHEGFAWIDADVILLLRRIRIFSVIEFRQRGSGVCKNFYHTRTKKLPSHNRNASKRRGQNASSSQPTTNKHFPSPEATPQARPAHRARAEAAKAISKGCHTKGRARGN